MRISSKKLESEWSTVVKKTISEKTVILVVFLSSLLYTLFVVLRGIADWEKDITGYLVGFIQISGYSASVKFFLHKINFTFPFCISDFKYFSEKSLA